jgi:hypothetical protein
MHPNNLSRVPSSFHAAASRCAPLLGDRTRPRSASGSTLRVASHHRRAIIVDTSGSVASGIV